MEKSVAVNHFFLRTYASDKMSTGKNKNMTLWSLTVSFACICGEFADTKKYTICR